LTLPDDKLRERTFGEVVRGGVEASAIDKSVARLLQATLTEEWGLNIRNEVAHGLLREDQCNSPTSDRLLHLALVVSQLEITEKV
jgi:hypothetical protein